MNGLWCECDYTYPQELVMHNQVISSSRGSYKHGCEVYYYGFENPILRRITTYEHGTKHGFEINYWEDGQTLKQTETFYRGTSNKDIKYFNTYGQECNPDAHIFI